MINKDQEIKRDAGKPELSLVPMTELLNAIARVREFGTYSKGYSKESWRNVEISRYVDALLRHTIAFADDPTGCDEESGLPHIDHIACNVAFLLTLMKGDLDCARLKAVTKCNDSNHAGVHTTHTDGSTTGVFQNDK